MLNATHLQLYLGLDQFQFVNLVRILDYAKKEEMQNNILIQTREFYN